MRTVINALAGLIFGLGLLISGMANPAKVQNFLDLAGTFDPSLIFVMVGAIVVTFLGYRFAFQRPRPILAERFSLATAKNIDARTHRRRGPVRHRLGPVRILPWPRHHLASAARQGHARLCAHNAHRYRIGAPSGAGKVVRKSRIGWNEQGLATPRSLWVLSPPLDRSLAIILDNSDRISRVRRGR